MNTKLSQYTEEELLRKYYREGDLRLLGEVLRRYTKILLGVGVKYVKDINIAQDLVQQVYLKALEKLPPQQSSIGGWLYVVMRNECIDFVKKQVQTEYQEWQQDDMLWTEEEATEEQHWEIDWKERYMLEKLQELKEEQRIALKLFYLEGKSYTEISQICNWTFGEVKTYIQNGKRSLRIKMEQK